MDDIMNKRTTFRIRQNQRIIRVLKYILDISHLLNIKAILPMFIFSIIILSAYTLEFESQTDDGRNIRILDCGI